MGAQVLWKGRFEGIHFEKNVVGLSDNFYFIRVDSSK